jgi:hypothetical protein
MHVLKAFVEAKGEFRTRKFHLVVQLLDCFRDSVLQPFSKIVTSIPKIEYCNGGWNRSAAQLPRRTRRRAADPVHHYAGWNDCHRRHRLITVSKQIVPEAEHSLVRVLQLRVGEFVPLFRKDSDRFGVPCLNKRARLSDKNRRGKCVR